MSSTSRQEKLASAKRKLKEFQQRRAPGSSPAPKPSPSHSLENSSSDLSFGSPFKPPYLNQAHHSPTQHFTSRESVVPESKGDDSNNGSQKESNGSMPHTQNRLSPLPAEDDKKDTSQTLDIVKQNEQVISNSGFSPTEKIKQISNQLNGLITKDLLLNADEQILKEISALEKRNGELEDSLHSYKRSNQQLTNQLNDQRKLLIQYQEKLKKEKTENAGRQSQELRAAKEQLEVHIQTIGILVSDKSELQENLRKALKKVQLKEGECDDLNNRLQAVRNRVVELERNISNLHINCEKYQANNRELAQELEKSNSKLHASSKEKEDLLQQTSELQEMLSTKASENGELHSKVVELTRNLEKSELVSQQLLSNSNDTDSLRKLNKDYDDMKVKLSEQSSLIERFGFEKKEIVERNRERLESLELKLGEQAVLIEKYEKEVKELQQQGQQSEELVSRLQNQIAEMLDKEAMQQTTATHVAANEIEKLTTEKADFERELDIQVNENRRLGKLVLDQDERIQELESAVARLGEDAVDRVSLLEDMQSDKETISRAMQQNKSLKEQLEQLEKGFVKTTNVNAELTTNLQREQHLNSELAAKISEIGVELEEKRTELIHKESTITQFQNEINSLKSGISVKETELDSEKSNLLSTVQKIQAELNLQIQQNDKLRHLEGQLELTDKLHTELQSAQDAVNLLSMQNSQLREALRNSTLEEPKHDHRIESPIQEESKGNLDESNLVNNSAETKVDEHSKLHKDDDADQTDNNETMEYDSLEQPDDSITQEVLYSYRNAIGQLEADRDELYELLQKERQESGQEIQKVKEHMEMQLQQQLKQQLRHVQEHFHQQLHDQQLKLQTMQQTIDEYKQREDLFQADVNDNGINYETLKVAFQQLQNRFKDVMDQKISLSDKLQEMEHSNLQLASETETIGEYINLYRTQRLALKDKFLEKDRLISQLSNEHSRMQAKISHLQELVMQTLSEKTKKEEENVQLQELVNKRLAIQSGDEREKEIPKFELSNDSLYDETISFPSEELRTPQSEFSRRIRTDSESSVGTNDGRTQQIMQIFDQLNDTGEGYQKGWLSPAVRRREFSPCKHCSGHTVQL